MAAFAAKESANAHTYSRYSNLLHLLGRHAPPTEFDFLLSLRTNGIARALETYRDARSLFPGWLLLQPGLGSRLAIQHLRQGDIALATELARMTADSHPNNSDAFDMLGECLEKSGRRDAAIRAYERVLELEPDDADVAARLTALRSRR